MKNTVNNFRFKAFQRPLALVAVTLQVQQEQKKKIAIPNHVQFGQVGVLCPVLHVAHLVEEEQLKKDHLCTRKYSDNLQWY